MLIHAIYLKKAQPISFFSPKDAYLIFTQLQKEDEIFLRILTGEAKNEVLQLDPPYALKC